MGTPVMAYIRKRVIVLWRFDVPTYSVCIICQYGSKYLSAYRFKVFNTFARLGLETFKTDK